MTPDQNPPRDVTRLDLLTGFLLVGLFGFGGIAASSYHVIVERRRWLTPKQYASTLGLGQVLPGANLINMTTIIGDRFHGAAGAAIALCGLMSMPVLILVALATLYDRFSDFPDVRAATLAAGAGAVGLTFGTAWKLARTILTTPTALVFCAATFVAIGVMRLPMLQTIFVLLPAAALFTYWRRGDE